MTDLIGAAETAISPYLFWVKLAGVVAVVLAIAAGGWYGRGVYDKPALDKAQLATADCKTASETTRADANAAASVAVEGSMNLASTADAEANARLDLIQAQSQHIMETVDAVPEGHALSSNPALGAYLDGLRGQAAGAAN